MCCKCHNRENLTKFLRLFCSLTDLKIISGLRIAGDCAGSARARPKALPQPGGAFGALPDLVGANYSNGAEVRQLDYKSSFFEKVIKTSPKVKKYCKKTAYNVVARLRLHYYNSLPRGLGARKTLPQPEGVHSNKRARSWHIPPRLRALVVAIMRFVLSGLVVLNIILKKSF